MLSTLLILYDCTGLASNARRDSRPAVQLSSSAVQLSSSAVPEQAGSLTEAAVEVRSAGSKGMGVYALEPINPGAWVGQYQGTLTTPEETKARYDFEHQSADYIFSVDPDKAISIDAQNSTHFSRYFNHAEHGNLRVEVCCMLCAVGSLCYAVPCGLWSAAAHLVLYIDFSSPCALTM